MLPLERTVKIIELSKKSKGGIFFMGRKYRFTFEQKLEAVTEHLVNEIF